MKEGRNKGNGTMALIGGGRCNVLRSRKEKKYLLRVYFKSLKFACLSCPRGAMVKRSVPKVKVVGSSPRKVLFESNW